MSSRIGPNTVSWQSTPQRSQTCEQFEQEWRAGLQPTIEAYLQAAPEPERGALFWELLRCELELRAAAGDKPAPGEYERRFPAAAEAIHGLLQARAPAVPEQIGRYQVRRRLGGGGFGTVYLCFDDRAQRQVAVKVPRPERLSSADALAAFLREARNVARLDHLHIVPLYDISDADDGCFLVYKYIEGQSLYERMVAGPVSLAQTMAIVAQAAEALHHAHSKSLFHRDIKPGNLLLDTDGKVYVTDFGLAILEEDMSHERGRRPGTYPYMAPEQVRGEGHRIDGRTDVYSLGLVLYELLTGRRAFSGNTAELFEQILRGEVRPPRQVRDTIPRELERICLKAMARQMSARYASAHDLAEDLRLALAALSAAEAVSGPAADGEAPTATDPGKPLLSSRGYAPMVPKGLRAFGPEDRDFFLELLPGPRDREGLPESVRFWKTQIEQRDGEQTFAVGLLYGPSGCGKSSLVKAGLLPRLDADVLPVYVAATAQTTEAQLAKGLRHACPGLDAGLSLPQLLAWLRRGRDLPGTAKVLIVLDQFEQWLHAHGQDMETSTLLAALRHADGQHVQCLLLVRDDFWMGISRLFELLEINLDRDRNARAVDLFDAQHTRRVLAMSGQALQRLPARMRDLTESHVAFLDRAVVQLSQDGRVIPVRLSLFADLMKDRPWTAASLIEVGGAEGVGLRFLEETFSARTALPDLRALEKPVRALLQALLPERGSDIKGRLRSRSELAEACGLAEDSARFNRLLEILDRELHIITPTEVEPGRPAALYYQLTHDYLVPSLRQWLTQEQRRTWRGRAELCLEERTAQWHRARDRRFLPSASEFLQIALAVPRPKRRPEHRALLRAAARHHGARWGVALVAALFISVAVQWYMVRVRGLAEARVQAVLAASPSEVPSALDQLRPYASQALPVLRERFEDPSADPTHRLHAALALAAVGAAPLDYLVEAVGTAPAGECANLVAALEPVKVKAIPALVALAESPHQGAALRVRCATMLLHLGQRQPASGLLAFRPDPTLRTQFILRFDAWHGELATLIPHVRAPGDAALRSGLCAALGTVKVESLAAEERQEATQCLLELFTEASDGATHSAAAWALRRWNVPLPRVTATREPVGEHKWFVNSLGMTMLEIPPGTFEMGDPEITNSKLHRVTLTRRFFVSDTEVQVEQFRRFMADSAAVKPTNWTGPKPNYSPTEDCPVQNVSWFDAVLFCNWLSAQEKCRPCYRQGEDEAWTYDRTADGYRLLAEAEWEYACRAGTTTIFSFGSDPEWLSEHGYFVGNSGTRSWPVGSKLPNPFGLFDMHGNIAEWCWDWHTPFAGEVIDPIGPATGTSKVLRGGSYSIITPDWCRSGFRWLQRPEAHTGISGFRVACGAAP